MRLPTLGSDPELFIGQKEGNDFRFVPICGKIGGTKGKPLPIHDMAKGFTMQEDNVMLEFNIPPATSAGSFVHHIETAMTGLWDLVHTRFDCTIIPRCAALFPQDALVDTGAQVFGCSPDFDGYCFGEKHATINRDMLREINGEWRFAGGHIHLGFDKKTLPAFVAAQFADIFLGLPAVRLDKQGKRRNLYGKAGRFRPTSYGIEYRTLSNFWLFDKAVLEGVADHAMRLCEYLSRESVSNIRKVHSEIPWREVKQAIETENEVLAADVVTFAESIIKE